MSNDSKCCSFLRGSFYVADFEDPCGGLVPFGCPPPKAIYKNIGNVETGNIIVAYDVFGSENKFHKEYNDCSRSQIVDVTLNLTINCTDKDNFEKFFLSSNTEGDSGTNSEEFYNFCEGVLKECDAFKLEKTNITYSTLVATLVDADGNDIRALVKDTEYNVQNRMVEILIDITEPTAYKIRFDYDYDDTNLTTISPLQTDKNLKTLMFRGVNYGHGENSIFDIEIFKFRHEPINSLEMIQENNFLNLTLQGTIEKFYAGSSEESYFKIIKGEV